MKHYNDFNFTVKNGFTEVRHSRRQLEIDAAKLGLTVLACELKKSLFDRIKKAIGEENG